MIPLTSGPGGIDQPPHLLVVPEIGTRIGPVGSSGLGDFRVFLIPAFPKGIQGGFPVHGGIDRLQIGHEDFQVFVGHILAGIMQLVDDAVLVSFQHLRLKFPFPVPGNQHRCISKVGAQYPAALTMFAICSSLRIFSPQAFSSGV